MKYTKAIAAIAAWVVIFGSLSVCTMAASPSYSTDQEFVWSVDRMYENDMTKYNDANMFRPGDYLTRQEAAKFFVAYVETFLTGKVESDLSCNFADITTADPTLQWDIEAACRWGLFYGANGHFMPNQPMTKAQAITVLVRALEQKHDETWNPRWTEYFQRARVLGITKETNVWRLDMPVKRYEIDLPLARSQGTREDIGTM